MKATNVFQTLKAKGVCGTDGIPPKLPGVSAAKFNAGLKKAAAQGKLDDNPKFKAAVEGSMANYGTALKKKSCAKFIPEEAGRKPKTRRPGKTRKRATRMLQGLINSNRGCGPNPYR